MTPTEAYYLGLMIYPLFVGRDPENNEQRGVHILTPYTEHLRVFNADAMTGFVLRHDGLANHLSRLALLMDEEDTWRLSRNPCILPLLWLVDEHPCDVCQHFPHDLRHLEWVYCAVGRSPDMFFG